MRAVSIIAVLLLLAANVAALLPAATSAAQPYLYEPYVSGGTLVLGLIALLAALAWRGRRVESRPVVAEAARPLPAAVPANQAEAEVVSFLATLQEKGRLVDFLMDDINAYDDGQVGAAARVVHTGCKAALQEHFRIRPLRQESEGARIEVAPGYAADEYRLLGKISGPPPFRGVLVHRGWVTDEVRLPRVLRPAPGRLPAIAPAEVELK